MPLRKPLVDGHPASPPLAPRASREYQRSRSSSSVSSKHKRSAVPVRLRSSHHAKLAGETPPSGLRDTSLHCGAVAGGSKAVPSGAGSPGTTPGGVGAGAGYDWARQWWPVAVLADLALQPRHTVQLLGSRLLLWRDPAGSWTAFQDRCPHRGAPLSAGSITPEGRLECPSHAWQFDSRGACTKIPQIRDPQEHDRATSNPAACATLHPTTEADGLLWVWGEGAPSTAPPPLPNLLANINARTAELASRGATTWYSRDLPLPWSTMLEGALDSTRLLAQRTMAMDVRAREQEGGALACDYDTPMGPYVGEFHPPGMVRLDYGPNFHVVIHVTPTARGECRWLMATWSSGEAATDFIRKYRAAEADPLRNHMELRSMPLDRDLNLMAGVAAGAADASQKPFYMPASTDLLPSAFRSWLASVGGPPPAAVLPAEEAAKKLQMPHKKLLDRYQQHVKSCSVCSKALKSIQKTLRLLKLLLPLSIALAALSYPLHRLLPLPLAAISAVIAFLHHKLLRQEATFFYVPQ